MVIRPAYTGATITDRFDGRGGSLPFVKSQTSLTTSQNVTSSLAMGMELFLKGIPLMKPRVYKLGEITRKPVIVYSDAEWTILDKHPWLQKGLGGIMWK